MPVQPGTLELLIQSLRRGEAVLIACDRDINGHGITSTFFDEETTLPTVAVRIAMRTGAAVIPIFTRRDGNDKYVIQVEPAIKILTAGNGALAKNVEQVVQIMERHIGHCPQQWATLNSIWAKSKE